MAAKKKIKNNLTGILAGLALAGCSSITPTGHINIAYIPERYDTKENQNEFMTELNLGLRKDINEDTSITIGGMNTTYMTKSDNFFFFNPNREEYNFYIRANYKNIEFFIEHTCSHPVDKDMEVLYDKDGNQRILNYNDITKIGLKYSF